MNFASVLSCLVFLSLLTACASTPSTHRPATIATESAPSATLPSAPAAPALPVGASRVVPAGSVLEIAIQKEIDTRTAQPKEGFPITVARGFELAGYTVVPAGATGHGEIVHAQKSGSFGKPAELLLAVRWIEVNGQRIDMRHFRPHTGADRTTTAGNLTFVPVAGLFSPFVRGGEIVLPVGTVALAQVREDTRIEGFAESPVVPPHSEPSIETAQP